MSCAGNEIGSKRQMPRRIPASGVPVSRYRRTNRTAEISRLAAFTRVFDALCGVFAYPAFARGAFGSRENRRLACKAHPTRKSDFSQPC